LRQKWKEAIVKRVKAVQKQALSVKQSQRNRQVESIPSKVKAQSETSFYIFKKKSRAFYTAVISLRMGNKVSLAGALMYDGTRRFNHTKEEPGKGRKECDMRSSSRKREVWRWGLETQLEGSQSKIWKWLLQHKDQDFKEEQRGDQIIECIMAIDTYL
jgi:hypothetical protein